MPDALYHPEHVHRALLKVDGIEDEDELLKAVKVSQGQDALPPEVYVRLLRRCRVEENRRLEGTVFDALVKRVSTWAARQYSGLSPADREDLSQEIITRVIEAVAKTTSIDWWEIRFLFNLRCAAADQYERLFDKGLQSATADIGDQAEELDDGGSFAKDMVDQASLYGRLAQILDPEEMKLVYPLLLSTIPISSTKAKEDLVRLLGRPEGTLREKKTAITRKLKAALERESLQ